MRRFPCPVRNVLLFHPFIENIRTERILHRQLYLSLLMEASLGSDLQKAKQELYKNVFLFEEGNCRCCFD